MLSEHLQDCQKWKRILSMSVDIGDKISFNYEAWGQKFVVDGKIVEEETGTIDIEFSDPIWSKMCKCKRKKKFDKLNKNILWQGDNADRFLQLSEVDSRIEKILRPPTKMEERIKRIADLDLEDFQIPKLIEDVNTEIESANQQIAEIDQKIEAAPEEEATVALERAKTTNLKRVEDWTHDIQRLEVRHREVKAGLHNLLREQEAEIHELAVRGEAADESGAVPNFGI
eukprot:TRINITY_DN2182_c0_g1_i1.p1 TRINITY_DN2182_c0_g1~~TRINITY_DN2182_c0_g1_i1.p1  ORF type:complete len:228 (+),score=67.19 TRINITY_DN2182_c0_g1_i1:677-1360(+)